MKRFFQVIMMAAVVLGVASCDISNKKTYEGPDQVAFVKTTYAYTLTADQTVNIPVQLISGATNTRDIPVKVAVSGTGVGSVVNAADVPATVIIKAGSYSVDVPVKLLFAGASSTAKTVILTLSADNIKVSGTLGVTTISVKK